MWVLCGAACDGGLVFADVDMCSHMCRGRLRVADRWCSIEPVSGGETFAIEALEDIMSVVEIVAIVGNVLAVAGLVGIFGGMFAAGPDGFGSTLARAWRVGSVEFFKVSAAVLALGMVLLIGGVIVGS